MRSSKDQLIYYEVPSPKNLHFEGNDVHIWFMSYKDIYPGSADMFGIISDVEKMHSKKYKYLNDRENFIIRHGVLRFLIGGYLLIDARDIKIGVSDSGKPYIERTNEENSIEFNMSHTDKMVVYGFSLGRSIGVDIELIKPIQDMNAIVDNYFSANEKSEFRSLPADKRLKAFYNGWTQKEAFVKALGDGLSRGLDQFDVSVDPDEPAALKNIRWDPLEVSRWTLKTIQAVPGYSVSIAVEGCGMKFSYRELSPGLLESNQ